jgi:Ala-tRNA(Pro) deacylase
MERSLYPDKPAPTPEGPPMPDADEFLGFIRHVIEKLWERGNVVVIGRGSQKILAGKPNVLHLRFIAPIDDRCKAVMAAEGTTAVEALKKIEAIDKLRAHYLERSYDADWGDATLYDLVLNTSSMSPEQTVDVIVAAVQHQEMKPTEALAHRSFIPARRLGEFLDRHDVKYVNITHSLAYTAQEIAASALIPGKQLAKTVIIKLDGQMAMVVLPAPDKVDFARLRAISGAGTVELANEAEFKDIFPECEVGAMPPFGNLYGMPVFVTKRLTEDEEIVFNAGSHTELIQLGYLDFERLVKPRVIEPSSVNS